VISVGRSNGSQQVALRYIEELPVKATILVYANYTADLWDANGSLSKYYTHKDGPKYYDFKSMRTNCNTFHQFHPDDDPFIPFQEAIRVKDALQPSKSYFYLFQRGPYSFKNPLNQIYKY